jgi:sensor domain CHASE-containing protein/signal transduction histidine kinase
MRLSTKTAAAVFLGVGLLTFGLGLAAESLVLRSFAEIEAEQARSRAILTKQNLHSVVEEFRRANQDWAEWDEVAEHLAHPNPTWAEENLNALSFQTKGWHHAAIVDDRGRGWSKALADGENIGPPSSDFTDMLTSGRVVLPNGSDRPVSGFVSIDGQLSMFSAEPLRLAGKAPAVPGAFVVTQRVDGAWLERFCKLTSTDLRVVLASGQLDTEEKEIWGALERGDAVVLRRSSDTELASYVSLEDFRGERVGFLAVREESKMVVAASGVVRAVRFGLLGAGAVFSLVSVLLLRLGIVSRLRSLIGAIAYFGRGELSGHEVGGADEIADLAKAFVEMRGKILDRERGVSENAAAVRLVLDHTGNGIVSVTRRGHIVGEISRAARDWLGEPGERTIADYIFEDDARRRAAVALGFEQLAARSLPDDLIVDQLPRLVQRNGVRLEIAYLVVEEEGEEDIVLLMLRDVTEAHELSHREAEARELHHLFARALRDRSDFRRFLAGCDALLTEVTQGTDDVRRRRALRALRDQCAVYGVETVTAACREVEEVAAFECRLEGPALERLPAAWRDALARFSSACPRLDASPVFLAPEEHRALVASMRAHGLKTPIVEAVAALEHAFSERVLSSLAGATHRTAKRLQKEVVVRTSGAALRIDHERTGPFWASLVHVVRNAVDHGIEGSGEDREAQGKPRVATIDLSADLVGDELVFVVRDDGAGIDWERVAEKAAARRLPHETREDLVDALFAAELSTKDEVTDLSGRGVGLSAVRAAVEGLGGCCHIESTRGAGSAFIFSIPAVIEGHRVVADPLAAFAAS